MSRHAALRDKMIVGKPAIGSFVLGHDPSVVRVAAAAQLDFLLLDYEHGTFADTCTSQFIDVAAQTSVSLFIRCTMSDLPTLPRLFDHGLTGALIAGAASMADVARIVQTVKYPPSGTRGLNPFVPAAGYGHQMGTSFMAAQNVQTHIWILAENQTLLRELDQISACKEIDGVFLGPYDLSVDLGVPGDIHHPKVVAEIEQALATLQQNKCNAGIFARDAASALPWANKGMSFIVVGFDWSLLQTAWSQIVGRISHHEGNGNP